MKRLFTLLLCSLMSIWANAQVVTLTLTQQPCNNDGIITASFSGVTFPATVTWYVDNQVITHSGVNTTSDALNNYSGNPVSAIVTGANNATQYGYFAGSPAFNVTGGYVTTTCPALGTITATVSGGAAPYSYEWINIATNVVMSTSNPASLPGGDYHLKVTDANGCVVIIDSAGVFSMPQFSVSTNTTPANCTNGTATASVSGSGVPPYSFSWSNGATTPSINSLLAGSYSVTVTDAQGCSGTASVNVPQSVNIGVNVTPMPATCVQNDGAVIAFGSGGVPPYTYNWSNGPTTQSQTNITSGSYSVTVTDSHGCIGYGYGYVGSTTPITVTQSATPSSCTAATGSASLNISGGQAPYTVTWNTYPVQTGTSISNVGPGTYSFHVTDANNCVRYGSVVVPPMNIITGSITGTPATCTAADGSLTVSVAGGATPYTYSWSNGATTQTDNNVTSGYYTVQITDNDGCSITKSYSLPASSPVSIGLSSTDASCIFSNDGSITATASGGTAPYSYSWGNGTNTAVNANVGAGYYSVYVTDANGCTANNYTVLGYDPNNNSCYCTITGTVYEDANANCTQDVGEQGISNIQVHCSGVGYAYTDANGVYSFKVPTGSYNISENVLAYYPLANCQSNNVTVNTTASSGCTHTVNFANTVNPLRDMRISTWDYTMAVPGNTYSTTTIITNEGTAPESSIVAGYLADNQLSAPTFTPAGIFTNGTGNWYDIAGGALTLAPGNSEAFYADYSVPTNMPINTGLTIKDTVVNAAPISNWLNDYSPWDNVNYFTTNTVGSFDPNFKEVSPKGEGPEGKITYKDSVLEYMVHFQNTGNYPAQKIVIIDTLDSDLDWTSLRPIYQSAKCDVKMSENGVVTFTFNNVNLPPATSNEAASNGMLTYTIKQKPNLAVGTQIKNSAAIYFDYNAPVITNTTLNTIEWPENVPVVKANGESFSLYPNPAEKMFYVYINSKQADAHAMLNVMDISGRSVIRKEFSKQGGTQTISVDASSLRPGVYFVNMLTNSGSHTEKLVIMK